MTKRAGAGPAGGLRQRFIQRIEECRLAERGEQAEATAEPRSALEARAVGSATSSREETPLIAKETPRGAFEFVGKLRGEEEAEQAWIGNAQQSLVEKAPPPLDVRAGTAGADEIGRMDLTSWDRAHLAAYTEPRNRVFPIFFYEPPPTPEVDRNALEQQVANMLRELRLKATSASAKITPKMLREASLAHERVGASGSLGSSSAGSSTLSLNGIDDGSSRNKTVPKSAFSVSVKSLAYRPDPRALIKQKSRRREQQLLLQTKTKTQEAGWNRPEYLMTPSTTYKTGNMEVWQRVRNAKEDKRLRVPFERGVVKASDTKTIVEQEEEAKLLERNSTAFLPNGLPKSNKLDPNRHFQRISSQRSNEPYVDDTKPSFTEYQDDAFASAQAHALHLIQLIDRREQTIKALRKLIKTARAGKSIQSRKSARKQLVPRRLGAKLDIVRKCTVDIALAVDRWRVAVDSSDDVRDTKPYGMDVDSTTMVVGGDAYFGLTPPPRPFLWRGLNYVIKMSHDLRFLDWNSSAWGGNLLPKIGLLSTETNPLLLPVTLAECSARAPVSVVERSALPLRVRTFRGIETSRIRAAATMIEDEVKHMHETATRLSSALKQAARLRYEEQAQTRAELRDQAQQLVEEERRRVVAFDTGGANGKGAREKKKRYLAHETSVVTIDDQMRLTSELRRRALTVSETPATPALIKGMSYNSDSGFHSMDGSSIVFTEESSTVIAEAIVEHALAIATDLDAKAALTLPSKPSTAEQHELQEKNPTIKSLATEFAQRLLDRGRSDTGLGTVSFEELIGMRRTGYCPRLAGNDSTNSSVGDANSWGDALDFATELARHGKMDGTASHSEPSRTPRAARQDAYCEMVRRIADQENGIMKMRSCGLDQKEENVDKDPAITSFATGGFDEGSLPQRSLSPVEESALVLAALLDARSSGADALQANDAPLFAHAVAMAPPKRRGENAATKAALAYASQLLELTSRNPADSQGEAKEDSVSSLQSKAQDKERRDSTEAPAHHLSNILVHTTIDKRPHDISIVTNHTEDSVQVVCIDNFGVVSRLRLCLSDVQDFSPSVFDLSQIEHANELVRWLDYRSIPTGLASARVKSLVYVPLFEPIPGSRPASLSLPKRLNSWSPKSIELLGSENASDSAIAVAFNSPKDRVSPIRDLEIELNLPAPYTECARSVTKIQTVVRGHQAKRKVEFKKKVRELKIARRKEKNEAIQMGVL